MELVLGFAERVGVPAAIAVLLIWRIEGRLQDLTRAILDLPASIAAAIHTKEVHP